MPTAISIENLSKLYRLGVIGSQYLYKDLGRWWASVRGQPDPFLTVGTEDHDNREADFIWALRDISFDVAQGEVVGIIGRNGAGKSTLLKILSSITTPTSGLARIRGRLSSLLEVGTGFHPELTGRENIYLNGAILGMKRPEIDRKLEAIIDFAGVEKYIDTPVKRYSSGMSLRLAFSVAAHLEPEIMVIDEVLAVGDFEFQKKCLGKMEDVASEGRTILVVSHYLEIISGLCTRAIWLDAGRLKADGPTSRVIQAYTRSGRRADRQGEGIDLTQRKDREGDGQIRITGIALRSEHGDIVDTVLCGSTLDFVLSYKINVEKKFRNVRVHIYIVDSLGRYVTSFKSYNSGEVFAAPPSTGAFVCRVPHFPLTKEKYCAHVRVEVDDEMGHGRTTDYIEGAGEFYVSGGDFYKNGRTYHSVDAGSFFCDYVWFFEAGASVPQPEARATGRVEAK